MEHVRLTKLVRGPFLSQQYNNLSLITKHIAPTTTSYPHWLPTPFLAWMPPTVLQVRLAKLVRGHHRKARPGHQALPSLPALAWATTDIAPHRASLLFFSNKGLIGRKSVHGARSRVHSTGVCELPPLIG